MTDVLASPAFVAAVGLLLLNDWVLKAALGNWVTGKLSDVAGLAAFSMFWSAIFPRHSRLVFMMTGATFAVWKSPLAEPALNAWNSLVPWPLARVQDYSDLVALGVLPPTYWLVGRLADRRAILPHSVRRAATAIVTAVAGVIAFTATSVYRPVPIEVMVYRMPATREEVIAALDSVRIPVSGRPKKRDANAADTLEVHIRQPPERWLEVTIEVRDAGAGESEIRTLALGPHVRPPSTEALRRAFVAQVVQPVRDWIARRSDRAPSAPPA